MAFKVGMRVDYMLKLISMTLTFMQGHRGSGKAKNQHCLVIHTCLYIMLMLSVSPPPPSFKHLYTIWLQFLYIILDIKGT